MYLDPTAARPSGRRSSSPTNSSKESTPGRVLSRGEAVDVALQSQWLAGRDRHVQAVLSSKMEVATLAKGTCLTREDEGSLFCLVSGLAVMTFKHPCSGSVSFSVIRPQRWFGEHAALGQRPSIMKVIANQVCQLIVIRQDAIRDMLVHEPGLGWLFFNLNALNVGEHLVTAVDLLIVEPRLRIISRLLTLAGRTPSYFPAYPVVIPLTQGEIARSANVSRSTAFNILGELSLKGICQVGYRQVTILDTTRLAALIDDQQDY